MRLKTPLVCTLQTVREKITFSGIEDTIGLYTTNKASLGFPVVTQCTALTEVVFAPSMNIVMILAP